MSAIQNQLVRGYANKAAKAVAEAAEKTLVKSKHTLSGDDSGLMNTWEEISVQVRGEESFFWDAYLIAMRDAVLSSMQDMDRNDLIAIWLITESGWNWHYDLEIDESENQSKSKTDSDDVPIDEDEIADFIVTEHLIPMAENYSNFRVENFLYPDAAPSDFEDESDSDEEPSEPEDSEEGEEGSADSSGLYTVMVDDNYNYMDESSRYMYGQFKTAFDAVVACERIVDKSLLNMLSPNITGEDLFAQYKSFGDDPYITGGIEKVPFSAWDYAKYRCSEWDSIRHKIHSR